MNTKNTVDAIYLTKDGISFDCPAPWPHQNLVILRWGELDHEWDIEFVYFGHYKNKLLYHDVQIEEKTEHMC